ncbi:NeuD/PglB/VioB family sugar acetyltransferase [Parafrankia discariae]|uniref:NeuD/PglB/VioB family sugar acetyltransferase n=1 Tax=Parafrankia discariae TaxID=365528 RepID=UPI0003661CF9|nr:NeuD/PglB/VioB family sugar acetyltransferase [Parafrankia discariae]
MRDLVVVGGGGHGRELVELVGAVNAGRPRYRLLGVLDDARPDPDLLAAAGTSHLGPVGLLCELDAEYVVGIGSPNARRAIDLAATGWGRHPATLVHPRAVVGRAVTLGPGSVVCALASVTTNVRTGRHVHLNVAATVAHDCRLGDYVTLAPGARLSGTVTLGDRVTVGTGATVIQGLGIGPGAVVGAGAVVVRDLPAEVVAVGVPARPRSPLAGSAPGGS